MKFGSTLTIDSSEAKWHAIANFRSVLRAPVWADIRHPLTATAAYPLEAIRPLLLALPTSPDTPLFPIFNCRRLHATIDPRTPTPGSSSRPACRNELRAIHKRCGASERARFQSPRDPSYVPFSYLAAAAYRGTCTQNALLHEVGRTNYRHNKRLARAISRGSRDRYRDAWCVYKAESGLKDVRNAHAPACIQRLFLKYCVTTKLIRAEYVDRGRMWLFCFNNPFGN